MSDFNEKNDILLFADNRIRCSYRKEFIGGETHITVCKKPSVYGFNYSLRACVSVLFHMKLEDSSSNSPTSLQLFFPLLSRSIHHGEPSVDR